MYGNNYGYYNPTRNTGIQQQPINNQYMQQPNQMPMNNYVQQPILPTQMSIPSTLQGKIVDNAEIVKVTDIPFDGSTSYFPLTDGSAIVTKQLQMDGTSKVVVYKPTEEDKKDAVQFATLDDIQQAIDNLDLSDIQNLKNDIEEIKKQLKELKPKKSKGDE